MDARLSLIAPFSQCIWTRPTRIVFIVSQYTSVYTGLLACISSLVATTIVGYMRRNGIAPHVAHNCCCNQLLNKPASSKCGPIKYLPRMGNEQNTLLLAILPCLRVNFPVICVA